jgi:hypothetical protein
VRVLTYSLLRLGLLALCFAGLYWVGAGVWLAFVVATFLAWGLSYVLLAGPRDAAALEIAERARARAERSGRSQRELEENTAEDAAVDAALAATGPGVPGVPVTAGPATAAAVEERTAPDAVRSERETDAEQHAVAELEQPGTREDGDESDAARADQHGERQDPRG